MDREDRVALCRTRPRAGAGTRGRSSCFSASSRSATADASTERVVFRHRQFHEFRGIPYAVLEPAPRFHAASAGRCLLHHTAGGVRVVPESRLGGFASNSVSRASSLARSKSHQDVRDALREKVGAGEGFVHAPHHTGRPSHERRTAPLTEDPRTGRAREYPVRLAGRRCGQGIECGRCVSQPPVPRAAVVAVQRFSAAEGRELVL